jgi:hypothetical protein
VHAFQRGAVPLQILDHPAKHDVHGAYMMRPAGGRVLPGLPAPRFVLESMAAVRQPCVNRPRRRR